MKRKRKQKNRVVNFKSKSFYPMMYCIKEDKPIAIGQTRCSKKVKVNWKHFREDYTEFLNGYELSLKGMEKGDRVYCPVCGGYIDFRLWMSDDIPHFTYLKDEKVDYSSNRKANLAKRIDSINEYREKK